jgi:DNA-binding response OmpR family regulator
MIRTASDDAAGKHILIAEDNDDLRALFAKVLKADNFQISVAGDGEEVIALLKDRLPDVLILDLGMPKLSGLDVLRYVRALDDGARIRVIVVTGNAQAQSLPEMADTDLLLIKPVSTRDLREFSARLVS